MKPIDIVLEGKPMFQCINCKNIQDQGVWCFKCNGNGFDHLKEQLKDEERVTYEVLQNVMIQGKAVDEGILVNLFPSHYITQDLLKRKLIVKTTKTESKNKAVRILRRAQGPALPDDLKKMFAKDKMSSQALEIS